MSEALAVQEPPIIERPVNVRQAMAGIYLLQGAGSLTQCLIRAGFSRATARNLQANGLTADRCLEEAKRLDPESNPANLLATARRRLAEQLAFIDPRTVALKDVIRLVDTTEKYFGGHALQPVNAITGLSDRLSGIVAVLLVARERGLPVPELPKEYVDAEVVSEPQDVALSPPPDATTLK